MTVTWSPVMRMFFFFLRVWLRVCFGDTQVGVQVRVCVWAEFMCLFRGCVLEAFSHSRGCRTAQSECIFTDGVWMNVNTALYHSNSTRCWSWSVCVCVHAQLTMHWHKNFNHWNYVAIYILFIMHFSYTHTLSFKSMKSVRFFEKEINTLILN